MNNTFNFSRKKVLLTLFVLFFTLIVIGITTIKVVMPYMNYQKASEEMKNGYYDEAIAHFLKYDDYKDSEALIQECNYLKAGKLVQEEKYDQARKIYEENIEYKDSSDLVTECIYLKAGQLVRERNYDEAIKIYESISGYKKSKSFGLDAIYLKARDLKNNGDYIEAINLFAQLGDYKDSKTLLERCKVLAADDLNLLKAIQPFKGTWIEEEFGTTQFVIDDYSVHLTFYKYAKGTDNTSGIVKTQTFSYDIKSANNNILKYGLADDDSRTLKLLGGKLYSSEDKEDIYIKKNNNTIAPGNVDNSADYDQYGNYKPTESMTKEEAIEEIEYYIKEFMNE